MKSGTSQWEREPAQEDRASLFALSPEERSRRTLYSMQRVSGTKMVLACDAARDHRKVASLHPARRQHVLPIQRAWLCQKDRFALKPIYVEATPRHKVYPRLRFGRKRQATRILLAPRNQPAPLWRLGL